MSVWLDMQVHEVLSNRALGGVGTEIPPYSTDAEANRLVRQWLTDNKWNLSQIDRVEEGRFRIVLRKRGITTRGFRVFGTQEHETFCYALLAAADFKQSVRRRV